MIANSKSLTLLILIGMVGFLCRSTASVITNSPVVYDVGGRGANVSYLVFDESSLSANPIIYAWHYSGATNPATGTNWCGTDLLNAVMSATKGSAMALTYTTGADGLTTSFSIGSATSAVVNPLTSPVWTYWIKGGSEYEPYGDNVAFTFNVPTFNWIVSPNTSDTRWLTNGSYDAWTISPFSFTGAFSDTQYYLDTTGSNQPVTFGTYSGAAPLSAVPPPVVPLAQTITPFATIANHSFSSAPFSIAAPVSSSGLPVTIVASPPGIVSISNSMITMLGIGTVTLTASQAGNANFSPASSVTTSFVIRRGFQTISPFAPIASRVMSNSPFTISLPVSTSGLPVTITASPANRVSIAGNTITLLGTGLVTLTASQGGTPNFYPASQVSTRFLIAPIRGVGR